MLCWGPWWMMYMYGRVAVEMHQTRPCCGRNGWCCGRMEECGGRWAVGGRRWAVGGGRWAVVQSRVARDGREMDEARLWMMIKTMNQAAGKRPRSTRARSKHDFTFCFLSCTHSHIHTFQSVS